MRAIQKPDTVFLCTEVRKYGDTREYRAVHAANAADALFKFAEVRSLVAGCEVHVIAAGEQATFILTDDPEPKAEEKSDD